MSFCLYNKKNITRQLEDMNFIFSWQKQYCNILYIIYVNQGAASLRNCLVFMCLPSFLSSSFFSGLSEKSLSKCSVLSTVASCSCERSFSALRRLKTWCRLSMGSNRLNGLALTDVHSETSPCGSARSFTLNEGILVVGIFVVQKR